MIVDLVVKNGRVVGPAKTLEKGWIAIEKGKIVAVGQLADPPESKEVIDAGGNYVIPGIIDPHTHPGVDRSFYHDIKSESKSAAAGGVTTFLGTVKSTRMTRKFTKFAKPSQVVSYHEVFPEATDIINNHSFVNVGFNFAVFCDLHAAEVESYVKDLGVTTFKFYHGYKDATDFAKRIGLPTAWDDGTLYYGLEQIGRVGALALFHAENNQITRILTQRLTDLGRKDLAAWEERSPDWCEAVDIVKFASLAKLTKTRLYVVHTSSKLGLEESNRQRSDGLDIINETCPHYMVLNKEKDAQHGVLAKVNVPIRGEEDNEALWEGFANGTVQCFGSDHIPRQQKKTYSPGNIWDCLAGFPGIETQLPVVLSEGVNKGRVSIERMVEVMSTNNAKVFNLYPQKGIIAPGSDADLVIVDIKKKKILKNEDLHTWGDYTVYEGREIKGWPITTMVNGRVVYQDGRFIGKPSGRYLFRTV